MAELKATQNTPEKVEENRIHIKNMVCPRCIMAVRQILDKLEIPYLSVELGEAWLKQPLKDQQKAALRSELESIGFELLEDQRQQLVEQIKRSIIELVHQENNELKINLSDFLAEQCHHDYSFLSKLFSEVCGITIEKYFIHQKIERVKELLAYNELSLSEIALLLNYSSTAHLSAQFKSVTGMTPTQFKQQESGMRKPLDQI